VTSKKAAVVSGGKWPPQVSLLECGVFGQHFASD
jgi:hypothetical protein